MRSRRFPPGRVGAPASPARLWRAAIGACALATSAALLSPAASAQSPIFTLSLHPCTTGIEVPAGAPFEAEFQCVLVTSENPGPTQGAQGWSVSLSADALEIVAITTDGTVGADSAEDPLGLRDGGFESTDLSTGDSRNSGDCEGRPGAVSAVVLSFLEPITLPPEGEATIARITVAGLGPAEVGASYRARIFYVDGCAGKG